MRIGIDASNIRGGGGVTHLVELLRVASPSDFGFSSVILWSGKKTLEQVDDKPWLKKLEVPLLNQSILHRTFWQRFLLTKEAIRNECDILFIPGGSYSGSFRPFVTMSQNLLPFEWSEIKRYGFSKVSLRLILLRLTQSKTFTKAQGTIFLTEHARKRVLDQFPIELKKTAIVNHGIHQIFFKPPRHQKDFKEFTREHPAKILYISFIGEYKHQWKVVKAIGILKKKQYPIEISFVGSPDEKKAFQKFQKSIQEVDPENLFIKYYSQVSYTEIEQKYKEADIFLFASSCETFGQIVTEAMASGLPIVCSNHSAMLELLGSSALFFNPEKPMEISKAIEDLLLDKDLRNKLAQEVYEKAKGYSWEKCANESFSFFERVIKKHE